MKNLELLTLVGVIAAKGFVSITDNGDEYVCSGNLVV